MKRAHSTEMVKTTKYPVIDLMESQKNVKKKGGTMRLGSYKCEIQKGTISARAYGKLSIAERHRHRYEFNNKYKKEFIASDLKPVGFNPELDLVEIVELQNHPWFVGVQFHPELKSSVAHPHPLFVKFIKAAMDKKSRQEI